MALMANTKQDSDDDIWEAYISEIKDTYEDLHTLQENLIDVYTFKKQISNVKEKIMRAL
ncbi:hypothetical protein HAX54_039090, partial [Datura stramonium]|nr:hypothetical protein [Datura stramonium]